MSATRHSHASRHQPLPHLTERLRRKSRKVTGPRQALLDLLRRQSHPMSSKEMFDALPKDLCDQATLMTWPGFFQVVIWVASRGTHSPMCKYSLIFLRS